MERPAGRDPSAEGRMSRGAWPHWPATAPETGARPPSPARPTPIAGSATSYRPAGGPSKRLRADADLQDRPGPGPGHAKDPLCVVLHGDRPPDSRRAQDDAPMAGASTGSGGWRLPIWGKRPSCGARSSRVRGPWMRATLRALQRPGGHGARSRVRGVNANQRLRRLGHRDADRVGDRCDPYAAAHEGGIRPSIEVGRRHPAALTSRR